MIFALDHPNELEGMKKVARKYIVDHFSRADIMEAWRKEYVRLVNQYSNERIL